MPVKKPARVPKFRIHKAIGQGYGVLRGRAGYLGAPTDPRPTGATTK